MTMVTFTTFPHIEEKQDLDWLKLKSEFEPDLILQAMNLSCTLFLLTYIYVHALHLIFSPKNTFLKFLALPQD